MRKLLEQFIGEVKLLPGHVKRDYRELRHRVGLLFFGPTLEEIAAEEAENRQIKKAVLANEYAKGYMAGWHECFRACLEAVEEEISRVGDGFDLDTAEWARGEQAEGKKQ
jgi:hypothetical protein